MTRQERLLQAISALADATRVLATVHPNDEEAIAQVAISLEFLAEGLQNIAAPQDEDSE